MQINRQHQGWLQWDDVGRPLCISQDLVENTMEIGRGACVDFSAAGDQVGLEFIHTDDSFRFLASGQDLGLRVMLDPDEVKRLLDTGRA